MNKVVAVIFGWGALALASASAIAAPKVTLGSAVGGPNTASVEIALWLQDASPTAATLQFDVQFDGAQLTLASVTPLAALGAHEMDDNVINGNTLRIVITPPVNNAVVPSGKIATLRFNLPTGAVSGSQTLHIAQLESFTSQALVVASVTTLDGFIADASNLTADADSDGMPDVFEAANGLHPLDLADAALDADGDTLSNLAEFQIGTSIHNADTDGDGMGDKFESMYAGLNPLVNDAANDLDSDGLSNLWEAKLGLSPSISEGTPLAPESTLPAVINANIVLRPGASYYMQSNVEVAVGAHLLAGPSSTLQVQTNSQITVNGRMSALGAESDHVHIIGTSPNSVSWKGLVFNASSTNSTLLFADISSATTSVAVTGASVAIRHCSFLTFTSAAVKYTAGGGGELRDSLIAGPGYLYYTGVSVQDASPEVNGNTLLLSANTIRDLSYGVSITGKSRPELTSNTITGTQHGVRISGSGVPSTSPQPTLHGNRIFDNMYANVYVRSLGAGAALIDASDNWWGNADIPAIATKINDGAHPDGAVNDGRVRFVPYLDAIDGVSTRGTAVPVVLAAGGTIAANTTWDVLETLTIANTAQLRIQPGATLRFYGRDTTLTVNGQLLVEATRAVPATFTTGYDTTDTSIWSGIVMGPASAGTSVTGALIEHAKYGLSFNVAGGLVNDSVMRYNMYGVVVTDASPTIRNSTFLNNTRGIDIEKSSRPVVGPGNVLTSNGYGVYIYGMWQKTSDPRPVINGNSIYGNSSYNLWAGNFQDGANAIVDATGNWWGSVDVPAIMSKIRDAFDGSGGPFVRFASFLDAENGALTNGSALFGTLPSSTILAGNTSYDVLESVAVPPGATLTIGAGAQVRFYNPGVTRGLTINGSLVVQGDSQNPVTFTSAKASPLTGDWIGVVVGAGGSATFDFADIEWATDGISYTGGAGAVRGSVVQNNKTSGIFVRDSSPTLQGNTIQNNQYGIRIEQNSSPLVNLGNTISNNAYGLYIYGNKVSASNPKPMVTGNGVLNNTSYNYYAYNYQGGNSLMLDGSNNWWGTNDVATIVAKIYDNMDGADLSPKLTFLPFLDALNGAATTGTVVTSATVSSNTMFVAGQTYDMLSSLTVQAGSTLTVQPGATLRFHTATSTLAVNGTLLVQGTTANPVRLTSSGSTAKGSWQGVLLNGGSNGNLIQNAIVEYAKDGVSFQANSGGAVRDSVVQNNSNAGIYIKDASPSVTGNTIHGNVYGVYVERKANPLIQNGNTITANSYGVYLKGVNQSGNDPMPVITGNSISGNASKNLYANTYYNAKLVYVNAANNWWGTTDVPTIVSKIYDNISARNTAPFAKFVPFLDAPSGSAISGTVLDVTAPGVPSLATGGTYDLLDTLTIPSGETLLIPAGVKMRFYGIDTALRVSGQMQVQGTTAEPVTITSGLLSPTKGVWAGVEFSPGTSGSMIQSAVIEWASNGVFYNNASGELRGSTVRNNLNGVYVYQNSWPVITGGNVITSNNIGVNIYGTRVSGTDPVPVITGNSLYGNSANSLKAYYFYNPASVHINATGNWWGTTSTTTINSTIYDYTDNTTYSPIVDYAPILTAP